MADVDRGEQAIAAKLLADDATRTLPIVCRLVPFDQWVITHIDTSWKIKDIKHWVLAKCGAWGTSSAPQPPRFRPASPVTFAVPSRRSSLDSGSYGETDDGEDDDWDGFAYDYNKDLRDSGPGLPFDRSPLARTTTHELPAMSASSSSINALSQSSGSESSIITRYVLFSFSSGHMLEDEGSLSWYKLRPFELLELHRFGAIVTLPRSSVLYVEPYFESPVQVSERPHTKRPRRARPTKSMEEQAHTVEWKSRWVIIRDGVLNLCKDPSSLPTHKFPLATLNEVRTADYLGIASKSPSRTICMKFKRSAAPTRGNEDDTTKSQPPWHPQDRRRPKPPKTSTWVVMDMPSHSSFENVLRVLHRLAPYPISSSFLPSSNPPKTPAPSPTVHTPAPNSPNSPSAISPSAVLPRFGVQYPEWRIAVLSRARQAGLGDIGPAMAHYLVTHVHAPEEHVYHDLPRAPSISEGLRRQASSLSASSASPEPPFHNPLFPWSDDADDLEDEDDIESEVEWDGWVRDITRRGERPPLPKYHVASPSLGRNGSRSGTISPSSPSSSSEYEGGSSRARTLSFIPDSKGTLSTPLNTASTNGSRSGRSRSSTVSAATVTAANSSVAPIAPLGVATYTSTTTTTITTYIDRVPDLPQQSPASSGRPFQRSNRGDRSSLSPPPSSPDADSYGTRLRNEGTTGGVKRVVRGVSIRNAFTTDRYVRSLDEQLDFVDGR